jgi:DNA (cytosine-5)-methyltransferase 1
MNELALFAGTGGGLLASRLLGWSTACAVELAEYPRQVLLQRQRDGHLDHFPIWDDVRTFDGRPWRGGIDIITGGFPCQDISGAGTGAGLAGSRSGLWFEYQRIIEEARPRFVFAENSPNLRTRGLGQIIEGLAALGYDARWCVLGAWHVSAPHRRDRMWVLAHAEGDRRGSGLRQAQPIIDGYQSPHCGSDSATTDPDGTGREEQRGACPTSTTHQTAECGGWWTAEPALGRVAHGVANRVDRLKAIGNGQVPLVAATAFKLLSQGWIEQNGTQQVEGT